MMAIPAADFHLMAEPDWPRQIVFVGDTRATLLANESAPFDYLSEIFFDDGVGGVEWNRTDRPTRQLTVTILVWPVEKVAEAAASIKSGYQPSGVCHPKLSAEYRVFRSGSLSCFLWEQFDESSTPHIICQGNDEILILSAAGPHSEKPLSRVFREIARRRLEDEGYVTFHASAVELDGRGVMIIGDAGVGKSTLSLGLTRFEGAWHLANDRVMVRVRNRQVAAVGFSAAARLNRGTFRGLGLEDQLERRDLKARIPSEKSDWDRLNGETKLNLLPRELRAIGFPLCAKTEVQILLFPQIRLDAGRLLVQEGPGNEILTRNCYTPDDPKLPEDWLNQRRSHPAALRRNAAITMERLSRLRSFHFHYSFDEYAETCHELAEMIRSV